MRFLRSTLTILALAALSAPGLAAQADHTTSMSLEIDGGPAVGLWFGAGGDTEIGLELAATRSSQSFGDTDASVTSLSVMPALKHYLDGDGSRVRPYLFAGVPIGHNRAEYEIELDGGVILPRITREVTQTSVGAILAIGLEARPFDRLAVGGHMGLRTAFTSGTETREAGPDGDLSGWTLGTMSSGIRVQVYF